MELNYIIGKFIQFIQIPQIHNCKIDKTSKVRFKSLVVGSNIKKYTYIAENSSILYCDIGAFSSIASDCFIGGASHPTEWMSTSPVFQNCRSVIKRKLAKLDYEPYKRTKIGNDVWIGTHSLIRAGVKIGDGAVVGMGSVVTKDIGPYEIWAGNPARLIRKRFSDEVIKSLLEIEWWNIPDKRLKDYECFFDKPEVFIQEYRK